MARFILVMLITGRRDCINEIMTMNADDECRNYVDVVNVEGPPPLPSVYPSHTLLTVPVLGTDATGRDGPPLRRLLALLAPAMLWNMAATRSTSEKGRSESR